jgi:hypothetical protein
MNKKLFKKNYLKKNYFSFSDKYKISLYNWHKSQIAPCGIQIIQRSLG